MEEEILTLEEACRFTGISKSSMYKLTAKRKLGFYKPTGKRIWFSRQQLLDFLKSNPIESRAELAQSAIQKKH